MAASVNGDSFIEMSSINRWIQKNIQFYSPRLHFFPILTDYAQYLSFNKFTLFQSPSMLYFRSQPYRAFTAFRPPQKLRLPSFDHYELHQSIKAYLTAKSILAPTFIQYALGLEIHKNPQNRLFHITAPTGTGKTLAYLLPMMHALKLQEEKTGQRLTVGGRPRAIVITASKQLVLQGKKVAKEISHTCKMKCEAIGIGKSLIEERDIIQDGVDILFANEHRLRQMVKAHTLSLSSLCWLVIDEADTLAHTAMLPGLLEEFVEKTIKYSPTSKVVISGTTNPPSLTALIRDKFKDNVHSIVDDRSHINLSNIQHEFVHCPTLDKHPMLESILFAHRNTKTIIFCSSVASLHDLEYHLNNRGVSTITLHSQLNKKIRLSNYERFRDSNDGIMLATDLGARGLDFPRLERVINYDFPLSACDYLQRVGRCGRAGAKGYAVSLYHKKDMPIINELNDASTHSPLKVNNSAYAFKDREKSGKSKFEKTK